MISGCGRAPVQAPVRSPHRFSQDRRRRLMPLRYPGLVLTVLVLAGLIGCGGGSDAPSSPRPAAGAASPVDEATAGSVAGRVVLQGQPPAPDVLSMSADPSCL